MGFRLRRSARLGPLRFHFTASGLSSISVGGRGASLNLPVNRRGGPRASVGIPGTGLSWSLEQPAAPQPRRTASSRRPQRLAAAGAEAAATGAAEAHAPALNTASEEAPARESSAALPNSRRLRPSQLQTLRQHCLGLFEQRLYGSGSQARRLWEEALITRLLADPGLGGRLAGQLALIETRQAMTAYLERSRSQDDLKRRCQRCLQATEAALTLCAQRGWLG